MEAIDTLTEHVTQAKDANVVHPAFSVFACVWKTVCSNWCMKHDHGPNYDYIALYLHRYQKHYDASAVLNTSFWKLIFADGLLFYGTTASWSELVRSKLNFWATSAAKNWLVLLVKPFLHHSVVGSIHLELQKDYIVVCCGLQSAASCVETLSTWHLVVYLEWNVIFVAYRVSPLLTSHACIQ